MKHEHPPDTNLYRFRQVKWGNPRHKLNALRDKVPVAVDDDPPIGKLFWVLVSLITVAAFAAVLFYGLQSPTV
ncbi:hypothetical protein [Pararhizobium antarcticum]|uniref:Uncharacterized protein n=1 Tax=Pararhizobium antarcticum TaxID=1798805 RepID=A0A657LZ78_9HYPH|nr:hypothetical protein [Pararhizobium antarcticum]OJF94462.1 hypothetical protein AX761_18340 [Rhizobium sp. 58]OJG00724.1 hypothetical protein AX760_09640 [Pararhizobium antarcticum]